MSILPIRWLTTTLCAALLGAGLPASALDDDDAIGFERTPPRLGFLDGEVSFLRPGAEDWTPARINTALSAGDELYAGEAANLEIQVAASAYVRAGENTQLGLTSLEPDFLQLRVTTGTVSLDLRSLKPGRTLELDTPNGAFTVEHAGYYRVEVDGDTTTFTSRRGGHATLTPATGGPILIAASEQVVLTGDEAPQIESYVAPELDAWDRWNYARTDEQLEAVSARYVAGGVYGIDDLDHNGDWRIVPEYGAIWVPRGVAAGWAPYSTGRWLWDPRYGWTWVDDAPWGWAPYHYGRWVRVSGYWGWCPGPIVARPYYAPALVAFYSGGGFSIGFSIGTPSVGWFALGWGEPLVPWWGSAAFRAQPYWAGWGGPRVVNKVVVKNSTVIQADQINVYQNAHEPGAFVTVEREHFGRGDRAGAHYARGNPDRFHPAYAAIPAQPDRSSLVADSGPAIRPPREVWRRTVVGTRATRPDTAPAFATSRNGSQAATRPSPGAQLARNDETAATPPVRLVQAPRSARGGATSKRPPYGRRGDTERAIPPPAPRYARPARSGDAPRTERVAAIERPRRESPPAAPSATATTRRPASRGASAPDARPGTSRGQPTRATRAPTPSGEPTPATRAPMPAPRPQVAPQRRAERRAPAAPRPRELPGEPANRVFRQRPERQDGPASMSSEARRSAPAQKRGRSVEARAEASHAGEGGSSVRQQAPPRGRRGRD